MKDYFSWEYYAMDKIRELAKADPDHRAFETEFEGIYSRYMELFRSLPPQQQAVLVDYECCQGNLRHIETMIAYELGRHTPQVLTDSHKGEKNSCNQEKSML